MIFFILTTASLIQNMFKPIPQSVFKSIVKFFSLHFLNIYSSSIQKSKLLGIYANFIILDCSINLILFSFLSNISLKIDARLK